MSYTAEISRANPSCFLFLVDQSGSMADTLPGGETHQRKCDFVADALNRLLAELSVKCAKEEGVRDYFHVGVVGYGASVGPAFAGALSGRDLIPLSDVASNPSRVEERTKRMPDGAGGLVEQQVKFPVWFDASANGGTPMSHALTNAQATVNSFLTTFPSSFPPIVLNLTDGEPTDGDPSLPAESLRALASTDGNVLLFNLHVSSRGGSPINFPDDEAGLPDDYAKALFRMSSVLPPHMRAYAQQTGYTVTETSRGFVYNADATAIVQFLEIGTRASDLR